jgi:hypothetical protein
MQHPTLPRFTAPSSSLNLISNIEQTETDSSTQPFQVLYSDLLSRSRTAASLRYLPQTHVTLADTGEDIDRFVYIKIY